MALFFSDVSCAVVVKNGTREIIPIRECFFRKHDTFIVVISLVSYTVGGWLWFQKHSPALWEWLVTLGIDLKNCQNTGGP